MATNSPTVDAVTSTDISVDNSYEQTQQIDATAESSTATNVDGAKEKSTLEMVKDALKSTPDDEANSEASPAKEKGVTVTGEDSTNPDAEATSEEDKKLPFHNHPRWKQVIEERDTLKQQVQQFEAIKQEAASYKERSDRFDMVSNFVQQNGLESQEVDAGFTIMAAISQATKFGGDPTAALEMLMPYVNHLQSLSGSVMPPDLQQKIDEGYIDEETAQDIARLRAENARANQRAEVSTQQAKNVQQQTESRKQEAVESQIMTTISEWESNWSKTDPDFSRKQQDVMLMIENYILKNGKPATTEQALWLANSAKESVEKKYKALLPNRSEMRNVSGGNPKGSPVQQVNSTQDAVKLALQGKYKMNSPNTLGA